MTGTLTAPLVSLLAAASLGAATPNPGKVVLYKDWTVGCDNQLGCEAISLMREDAEKSDLQMTLSRGGGKDGALKLAIWGFEKGPRQYRLLVNGKLINSGAIEQEADSIEVTGADALKVAKALTWGHSLKLQDGAGKQLGELSLAGTTAALRYIDTAQGRAGSKGALVATGSKAATARMPKPIVIPAQRIGATADVPDAASLVALSEGSPCAAERFGPTEDAAYSLGKAGGSAKALVLLNCGSGAYNFASGAYVGTRDAKGKWAFLPASFDYIDLFTDTGKIPLLINSDWDPASQTLGAYSKGRGLGDCGSSEQYVWDGAMFRLTNATSMTECRGSLEWIQVWQAEVAFTS